MMYLDNMGNFVKQSYILLPFVYYIYWSCIILIMKSQTHLPKDPTARAQLINTLQTQLNKLRNPPAQASVLSHHRSTQNKQQNLKQQQSLVNPVHNSNQTGPNQQTPPKYSASESARLQQIIKLRLKLIGDCQELSVARIEHLEQIFKHYCTHIFKTGKHMTFQRLEYEKVHLTLDRFCVFLKDFGLTSTKIKNGQSNTQQQIIDKSQIVRNFKRISKTCRDLSFEQFIACLQKLAIVHYDEKQIYKQKVQKQRQEREARIFEYKKKMKQKKKQEQARKSAMNKNSRKVIEPEENQNDNEQDNRQKENNGEENDDLVQKMMEDDKIQNPNDQIEKAVDNQEGENEFGTDSKAGNKSKKNIQKQQPLPQIYYLTVDEKIEYFYQLISVDNVQDFRKKMSQLGLPLFKLYQPPSSKPHHRHSSMVSKLQTDFVNVYVDPGTSGEKQDERRLIELRQKLNQKKERDKQLHSPSMSKQDYQQRKRKREQRQAQIMKELNVSPKIQYNTTDAQIAKQKQKKRIQIMDKEISLDMLNHIAFQDLRTKFNPKKYVSSDETDDIYLSEYGVQLDLPGSNKKNINKKSGASKSLVRQNTATTLQRKRTSSNIVEDFKKRAYEMQVKQFHKQAQMSKFVDQMRQRQRSRMK